VTATLGGPRAVLDPADVAGFVRTQLARVDLDGRSLCLVVPDATRRCPLPLLLDAVRQPWPAVSARAPPSSPSAPTPR
jgi:hypothetical protein